MRAVRLAVLLSVFWLQTLAAVLFYDQPNFKGNSSSNISELSSIQSFTMAATENLITYDTKGKQAFWYRSTTYTANWAHRIHHFEILSVPPSALTVGAKWKFFATQDNYMMIRNSTTALNEPECYSEDGVNCIMRSHVYELLPFQNTPSFPATCGASMVMYWNSTASWCASAKNALNSCTASTSIDTSVFWTCTSNLTAVHAVCGSCVKSSNASECTIFPSTESCQASINAMLLPTLGIEENCNLPAIDLRGSAGECMSNFIAPSSPNPLFQSQLESNDAPLDRILYVSAAIGGTIIIASVWYIVRTRTHRQREMINIEDTMCSSCAIDDNCSSIYKDSRANKLDSLWKKIDMSENMFNIQSFRNALTADKINYVDARKELDKCKNNDTEIKRVYGEEHLSKTVLFYLLHSKKKSKEDKEKIYNLIAHPVIRCVIKLKWEIFGERMYIQQLLAYMLLLMCMTLSATLSKDASFSVQLRVWLSFGVGLVILLCGAQVVSVEKSFLLMLVVVVGVWMDLFHIYSSIAYYMTLDLFIRLNALFLICLAFYFIRIEVLEFLGESYSDINQNRTSLPEWANSTYYYITNFPEQFLYKIFGRSKTVYFESYINVFQLPTFWGIFAFGWWQVLSPTINDATQIMNIALIFFLWVLGTQYLEVNETAGNLIPMMRGMVDEVVNFLIFYAPFQFAYTSAYFILFQDTNEEKYSTIWHTFTTTFLVVLGQIDFDPFESLESPTLYGIGYALLASNGFIVVVLQLNLLVAMMTNSIDEIKSKAKRQALISFALCIMRNEKIQGLIPYPSGKNDENSPLMNHTCHAHGKILGFENDDPWTEEPIDNVEKRFSTIEHNLKELGMQLSELKDIMLLSAK